MKDRKIIFYELNEVPIKVLDYFTQLAPNSSLAKLRRHGRFYESVAEDAGGLSPWITWPTLHRGVTNKYHEISDLGQDLSYVNKEYPPIWEILANSGVRCGIFGSLQSYPLPSHIEDYAYYVPDTFAIGPECFPPELSAFQKFNLNMVDKSGRNVDAGIALKDAAAFLRSAPGLGLRGRTAMKLAKQVAGEFINSNRVVRRRTSQIQIAFDFFLKALRSEKPDITFFFTNHVASSMHRYWPASFPEDYKTLKYSPEWCSKWGDEISYTMSEADEQIGDLIRFVDENDTYSLVVASSMGQEAVQTRIPRHSQLLLTDPLRFAAKMGLRPDEFTRGRAMMPSVVFCVSEAARDRFLQAVSAVCINGRYLNATHLGENRIDIHFGFPNINEEELEISHWGKRVSPEEIGASYVKMRDAAGANAYHVPEGILLVYDPKNTPDTAAEVRRVSTVEIAPSLLANFGVAQPNYMRKSIAL